ncbi:zinc finger protein 277-like isoform X1 [Trematomus bernacchii]|uniref:zinc finger protein 277-like isoform X1 n=1 Tax=Trematomus bernacchii TaxID=40690 RepID=UPI00146D739A|nr:zinc finger protein 277-like isoform X1 [Trematomus bernacchii]
MAACTRNRDGDDSILEPLSFPEQPPDAPGVPGEELLVCLFCPDSERQKDVLLKHLLLEHKLVIADVKLIADLPKYELQLEIKLRDRIEHIFIVIIQSTTKFLWQLSLQ